MRKITYGSGLGRRSAGIGEINEEVADDGNSGRRAAQQFRSMWTRRNSLTRKPPREFERICAISQP